MGFYKCGSCPSKPSILKPHLVPPATPACKHCQTDGQFNSVADLRRLPAFLRGGQDALRQSLQECAPVLLRASWSNNISAKATTGKVPFSQAYCDHWSGFGADLCIENVTSPIGKATPFAVDLVYSPNGSFGSGTFAAWTLLTSISLPPQQRDNAWTSLAINAKAGPLTYQVTEWGPNTVTLNLTSDKALACRKLASNTQGIGPNGKIDNLCKWTTATFTVHVDVKKPGTPLP